MDSTCILNRFPVRKSQSQKSSFRSWLSDELHALGYAPFVEEKFGHGKNLVAGDPDRADVILTAHYDTCAALPIPNFCTPRNPVVYILYQLIVVELIFALAFLARWLCMYFGMPEVAAINVHLAVLLFCLWWIVFGKANRHNVNDNSSGVMTLCEIADRLPEEYQDRVCFVWFDNEEKGLLGSALFAKMHPHAKKNAIVLNYDCVSDGEYIQLFPTKELKREPEAVKALEKSFTDRGEKHCEVVKGCGIYASDQNNFKRAVGICALHKNKVVGYYMHRIHTWKDVIMDYENIEILRDQTIGYIESMLH